MLLELRLFSLLDLLLDASQRLGCSLVGLGSVAQPGVDLVGVVWFYRTTCVKLHDGQHNLNVFERQIVHPWRPHCALRRCWVDSGLTSLVGPLRRQCSVLYRLGWSVSAWGSIDPVPHFS